VPDPTLSWRLLSGPVFGNAVATLVFSDRKAELVIEQSGRSGQLEPVCRVELADPEVTDGRRAIGDEGVHRS
jgi:hypothetical protein